MPKAKKVQARRRKQARAPKKNGNGNGGAGTGMPVPKTLSRVGPQKSLLKAGKHRSTCSILDPFCPHARNAQRPDGGPPSIPYQIRHLFAVTTTTTTGKARVVVIPNPYFDSGTWVATAGTGNFTTLTAWTATPSAGTGILSQAKELRIVSFGCIARSVASATQCKGEAILVADAEPVIGDYPNGTLVGLETVMVTLAPGMEHSWVSKPKSDQAHLMKLASIYTNTFADFDWTSFAVEIQGAETSAATTVIVIEVVMNIEFTLDAQNSSGGAVQLHRTPPVPDPHAINATKRAQTQMSSFVQGGIDKASQKLSSVASTALDDILSEGMAFLGFL